MELVKVRTDSFAWASCLVGALKSCKVDPGLLYYFDSNLDYIQKFNPNLNHYSFKKTSVLSIPNSEESFKKADQLVDFIRRRDSGVQSGYLDELPEATIFEISAAFTGAKTKKTHQPETGFWGDVVRNKNLAVCFAPHRLDLFKTYLETLGFKGELVVKDNIVDFDNLLLARTAGFFCIPRDSDLLYSAIVRSFKYSDLKEAGFGLVVDNPGVPEDRRRVVNSPVLTLGISHQFVVQGATVLKRMIDHNFDDHAYLKDYYGKNTAR